MAVNSIIMEYAWHLLPHLFAERCGHGAWIPYNYLIYISEQITQAIAQGKGRIIVEVPPRHGKSELISHWTPAWYLNLFPNKRVILTTYEAEFAAHWGRRVRNTIEHTPEIDVKIKQDSRAANRWETTRGGGMVTAGVGGPITGRGGDLIIVDDPVKNWEQATSVTYREKAKDWFRSTLYTRLEPGATMIILQTRWHEDDLAGWLQSEHGDEWHVIRFPAICEEPDMLGRSVGDALCPLRYDVSDLAGIETSVGPMAWNALYQQRPSAMEGQIIKRAYFKDRMYETLPKQLRMAMSWDMSFDDTDNSSFVVGQVWGRDGANAYLVDQVRERMDFVDTLKAFHSLRKQYPHARAKVVEKKANGPAIMSQLRSKVPGLIAYNPKGSKLARMMAVSPFFAAGNVWIPVKAIAPWIGDWIEELVNFPNAPQDDQADATSQMLEHWFGDGMARAVKPSSQTRKSPLPR